MGEAWDLLVTEGQTDREEGGTGLLQDPRLKWLLSLCRVLGSCQLSATTGIYSLKLPNVPFTHLNMALALSGIKDQQLLRQLPAFPALSPFFPLAFYP